VRDLNTPFGISRRKFLGSVGDSVVAGSMLAPAVATASEAARPERPTEVNMSINGQQHRVPFEPSWTLLYLLRDKMGITGTKLGCERGECGACTVLVEDVPR